MMKWLSEDHKDLHELYINQLRVLLSAEEQIVRALPPMIDRATDAELQQAFQSHLLETENQVKRLEELLSTAKAQDPAITSVGPIKCKAISALITEAEDMVQDTRNRAVRDAALIAAAQRVEHYEIAAYGAVRHFARVLGDMGAVEILDQTIKEEGHADHLLTSIAERINIAATRTAA
jgi:ferritin-like metal-binding protein YciE